MSEDFLKEKTAEYLSKLQGDGLISIIDWKFNPETMEIFVSYSYPVEYATIEFVLGEKKEALDFCQRFERFLDF